MANRSSENGAKFKYWGTTVTHQNMIHEEIKSRLKNSGSACCRSLQNILSLRLLSKSADFKIWKIIILLVLPCGCETSTYDIKETKQAEGVWDEVAEENNWPEEVWNGTRLEKIHNLYYWPNMFWVIKSRRTRWLGRISHIGPKVNTYRALVGKPDRRRSLDGRRILKRIFEE
jgi:hypothetical protein